MSAPRESLGTGRGAINTHVVSPNNYCINPTSIAKRLAAGDIVTRSRIEIAFDATAETALAANPARVEAWLQWCSIQDSRDNCSPFAPPVNAENQPRGGRPWTRR